MISFRCFNCRLWHPDPSRSTLNASILSFEPLLNFGFLAMSQETRAGRAPHSQCCVPLARALHVTCRGLLRLRGAYRPYHRPWATRRFIYGSDMDNGECMGESKYGRCPCSSSRARPAHADVDAVSPARGWGSRLYSALPCANVLSILFAAALRHRFAQWCQGHAHNSRNNTH